MSMSLDNQKRLGCWGFIITIKILGYLVLALQGQDFSWGKLRGVRCLTSLLNMTLLDSFPKVVHLTLEFFAMRL